MVRFWNGPEHSKTEPIGNPNAMVAILFRFSMILGKMAAILFQFPMISDKMAAILFKTEHLWKPECYWKTEQRATIVILNAPSIPAPTVLL